MTLAGTLLTPLKNDRRWHARTASTTSKHRTKETYKRNRETKITVIENTVRKKNGV